MSVCRSADPLISILLPVFNGERFLRDALDSILNQTYTNFELLISDNHSTDSTEEICLEYVKSDSRIIYHRNSENLGIFKNVELLTMRAKGDFLMWVGDDDIYEHDCLASYIERMMESKDIILVFSDYSWIDAAGEKYKSEMREDHYMLLNDSLYKNMHKLMRYASVLPIIMGMFKTSVCKNALPFPNYTKGLKEFTGGIDLCFLWKVIARGKIDSIQRPLFSYRIKDRGNTVPESWGGQPRSINFRITRVNFIILKNYILPNIWMAKIGIYQKLKLTFMATAYFVVKSIMANI